MALFGYRAMTPEGRIVAGRLDALNASDLEVRLKRLGLDFIHGDIVRSGHTFRSQKATRRDLINFCFHLGQLIEAGVPIVDGLTDLRDSLESQALRETIASMVESIDGGRTLSQAMSAHPQVFDHVFISLIVAGEQSGRLAEILSYLFDSLKWQDELAAQTRRAIMYPAIMGSIVLGVTVFMMIYLVPKMLGFITNAGLALPLHTQALLFTSRLFVDYGYLLFGLPAACVLAVLLLARNWPALRLYIDSAKLRLPLVGVILRKIALARFASIFAMMYASGISVLDSLHTTQRVIGNRVIEAGLQRVIILIGEGQGITTAFQQVALFPPLVLRMLRVGETTGALDTALNNVSYFYSRDVRESISRLQVLIEPALTVILGLVLGWVMLAVLSPVYEAMTRLRL